ncbi:MAG TPA: alpha/beta fold hydrolase [Pirellulales bacterium]|jgi:pimeloyl-ACP methyl ester carboxylesterase|nr:alpha/beta fold hydrolase [Pirellulales bacterium]
MLKQVEIPGAQLAVKDVGDGSPVLFVHGFPLSHAMWRSQIEELAATHRVIAPDLRGFGSSCLACVATVTIAQLADDCAALLDALGVGEPVTFCGLSMGGYVGFQFVRKYGDRLKAIVLCDTRAAADSPEAAANRYKMAEHVMRAGTEIVATAMLPKLFALSTAAKNPEVVEAVKRMILATAPETIAAVQHAMAERPDVQGMLPTIRVPTLVLVGQEDAISPVDEMRAIAAGIPGAQFVIVPEAGHMAPMENPAAVNQALRTFLGSL